MEFRIPDLEAKLYQMTVDRSTPRNRTIKYGFYRASKTKKMSLRIDVSSAISTQGKFTRNALKI